MSSDSISLQVEFPINPSQLYTLWLSSDGHSQFTGGTATITDKIGSNYSAWDGYINGTILALDKDKRILHSWRSAEFTENDEDSELEIILEENESGGTKLILNHTNIPKGEGQKYKEGWEEHYFAPMRVAFDGPK